MSKNTWSKQSQFILTNKCKSHSTFPVCNTFQVTVINSTKHGARVKYDKSHNKLYLDAGTAKCLETDQGALRINEGPHYHPEQYQDGSCYIVPGEKELQCQRTTKAG